MIRRSFLRLAGAAVLGVVAARVPVFAEDVSEFNAYGKPPTGEVVSMYIYPTYYALPIAIEGVLEGRTITVPAFTLPSNMDSAWVVGPQR